MGREDTPNEAGPGATGPAQTGPDAAAPGEPLTADTDSVQIVKGGEVGEDELAALVAGIVAAAAGTEAPEVEEPTSNSRWVRGARQGAARQGAARLGAAFPSHGRDTWRWSLR